MIFQSNSLTSCVSIIIPSVFLKCSLGRSLSVTLEALGSCGTGGEQTFVSLVSSLQAYNGHHQALEVLLQSLVDLDIRDEKGRTALDLAAFKGHTECVEALINQGASIFVKDNVTKRTPLHASGRYRQESGYPSFVTHLSFSKRMAASSFVSVFKIFSCYTRYAYTLPNCLAYYPPLTRLVFSGQMGSAHLL